jgi:cytidylate kinase
MASIDAIVNRQLLKWHLEKQERARHPRSTPPPLQVVTVSRQVGSGGTAFARRLAEELGFHWMHREVIEAICNSSGYRRSIIETLDNRFRSNLEVLVDAFFTGQAVDHSDYRQHLFQVVHSLAQLGGVVLVGRGGRFILGSLRGFHIRVVGPREYRIGQLMTRHGFSKEEAEAEMKSTDNTRSQFVRKLFGVDIDSPEHYDLVLNLGAVDDEDMIEPTVAAIRSKLERLAEPVLD